MTKRIQVRQRARRWQAYAYPSRKTYTVTTASGNRLMGIANSDSDYNVYHYSEGGRIALEIHRNEVVI